MAFSGKWMDLQIIVLILIRQTNKDKGHIFFHRWNLYLKLYSNSMFKLQMHNKALLCMPILKVNFKKKESVLPS